MSLTRRTAEAVDAGLDQLVRDQLPSGEFESHATPLGVEPAWEADSSVFVTSLCVLALGAVEDDRVAAMSARARDLIRREAAPGPLWRFWTHDHDRHREIPCDADDTACATMALGGDGPDAGRSRRLLLANRDAEGRFRTWFLPRGAAAWSPGRLRNSLGELRDRSRRAAFWEMTEADPDDVDGVVNANVLRLLGPASPTAAVELVSDAVRSGRERECDSWHRNEHSCWWSLADGHRRGVPYADEVVSTVVERIRERAEVPAPDETPLDVGHALAALRALRPDGDPATGPLVERLLAAQRDDGSWERSIFFYGGPKEVFAWGSSAYTTAVAVGALDGA